MSQFTEPPAANDSTRGPIIVTIDRETPWTSSSVAPEPAWTLSARLLAPICSTSSVPDLQRAERIGSSGATRTRFAELVDRLRGGPDAPGNDSSRGTRSYRLGRVPTTFRDRVCLIAHWDPPSSSPYLSYRLARRASASNKLFGDRAAYRGYVE